jgi:MoaA/NifB/PqqE/SkfB family radical SAM enzyme
LGGYWLCRRQPPAPPFRLWVDVTSRCNLACPACPQPSLEPGQRRRLDDAVLDSLCRQIGRGLGVAEVNLFHRGEPLLHPELGLWARRFRAAGAWVRLHTNATLLTPGRAAALALARPRVVTLSIDTLHAADYARARPGAGLDQALAGAERLLAARRLAGGGEPAVQLLLMGPQRRDPDSRRRLKRLRELGLDRVVHRRPHNWAGACGPAAGGGRPAACTFPWYGLAVLSDGRVTPCPQDFFGELTLGRADRQGLAEIWHGPAARDLRAAHAAGELAAHPLCAACDRPRRPRLLGLPVEHLHNLWAESIIGLHPRRGGPGRAE